MTEAILVASTILAAFTSTLFVVLYHRRLQWWRTHMGRSVMSLSAAVAGLAWLGIARRLNDHVVEGDLLWLIKPLVAVAWIVVTAGMVYRIAVVLGGTDEDHDRP